MASVLLDRVASIGELENRLAQLLAVRSLVPLLTRLTVTIVAVAFPRDMENKEDSDPVILDSTRILAARGGFYRLPPHEISVCDLSSDTRVSMHTQGTPSPCATKYCYFQLCRVAQRDPPTMIVGYTRKSMAISSCAPSMPRLERGTTSTIPMR